MASDSFGASYELFTYLITHFYAPKRIAVIGSVQIALADLISSELKTYLFKF